VSAGVPGLRPTGVASCRGVSQLRGPRPPVAPGVGERQPGELLPPPWDCILVELEEGPLFISNPRGFTSQDAYLHMPVRLCFLDCEDRWGPFKLPVFERREPDPPDHRLASRGEPQSPLNSIYIIDFLD
jgi:hypothetical protein